MKLLVTAGNTQTPIDRVRCITNIFTGRTGASIAIAAYQSGHAVTLLTSHPEAIDDLNAGQRAATERWTLRPYRTFQDLQADMTDLVQNGGFDGIVHCASVSDYHCADVYGLAPGSQFQPTGEGGSWKAEKGRPTLVNRRAGKVKSDEPELWLRLTRTPKLVDFIRSAWGFQGVLVKFKLEVGVTEEELLAIAESSRVTSGADLMVANTLEESRSWAFVGPLNGTYQRVNRRELPARLVEQLERQRR